MRDEVDLSVVLRMSDRFIEIPRERESFSDLNNVSSTPRYVVISISLSHRVIYLSPIKRERRIIHCSDKLCQPQLYLCISLILSAILNISLLEFT